LKTRAATFTLPLLALFATSACFSTLGIKQKNGLGEVDELLSEVEALRVESAVAKERAQVAFDTLRTLIAPEFKGDPSMGHHDLVVAIELSEEQAESFQDSVKPLRRTGEKVFERWTADLESFGNVAMRQRSQERLEETRRRHDVIVAAAVSAQLAYDAFNGDLQDSALFLEHDFNTTSVALVAQEIDGLRSRGKELARRLDACSAACVAFVEFSAPKAQVPPLANEPAVPAKPAAEPKPSTAPAPAAPTPPKKVVLKKKPAPAPAPAPTPAPETGSDG
jgi:hypothetical protein